MNSHTLNIILSDIFELHGYTSDKETFLSLIRFLSFTKQRILFCKERKLYVDNSIVMLKKDDLEYAKIGNVLSLYFLKQEQPIPFIEDMILDLSDVMSISLTNQIPMTRLTYEYDNIYDLPATYIGKLNRIHSELKEVFDYCITENVIREEPNRAIANDYLKRIRSFISNELNKE